MWKANLIVFNNVNHIIIVIIVQSIELKARNIGGELAIHSKIFPSISLSRSKSIILIIASNTSGQTETKKPFS